MTGRGYSHAFLFCIGLVGPSPMPMHARCFVLQFDGSGDEGLMQKLLQSLPRSKRDSDRESVHTTRLHVSCSCLMPMHHVSCLMLMLMPMHHVLCSCPCITSHVSCSCFILRVHGRHSWSHGRNANAVSQFSGSILVLLEGILKGNSLHGAPTLPCLRCFCLYCALVNVFLFMFIFHLSRYVLMPFR